MFVLAGTARADYPGEPSPPGANNWACKPSTAHPEPVVLVHGLGATMAANWSFMSPFIAKSGYCVFALDLWARSPVLGRTAPGGVVKMETSALELSAFVARVRPRPAPQRSTSSATRRAP